MMLGDYSGRKHQTLGMQTQIITMPIQVDTAVLLS